MENSVLSQLPTKETNSIVFTPEKIAEDMVDMLPDTIWNSSTTFLDPACKSGIFLAVLYNKLFEHDNLKKDFPDPQQRSDHILTNQLFGIALSQYTLMLSTRTLYGRMSFDQNIILIDDYLTLIKSKTTKYIQIKTYTVYSVI